MNSEHMDKLVEQIANSYKRRTKEEVVMEMFVYLDGIRTIMSIYDKLELGHKEEIGLDKLEESLKTIDYTFLALKMGLTFEELDHTRQLHERYWNEEEACWNLPR
jgi:hypothetical protein